MSLVDINKNCYIYENNCEFLEVRASPGVRYSLLAKLTDLCSKLTKEIATSNLVLFQKSPMTAY
jgi:hypothetical protein